MSLEHNNGRRVGMAKGVARNLELVFAACGEDALEHKQPLLGNRLPVSGGCLEKTVGWYPSQCEAAVTAGQPGERASVQPCKVLLRRFGAACRVKDARARLQRWGIT